MESLGNDDASVVYGPNIGLDKFCRQNFEQNKRFLRRAFCWQNKAFSSRFEKNRGKSLSGTNDIHNSSKKNLKLDKKKSGKYLVINSIV